jgi:hypothetical protein
VCSHPWTTGICLTLTYILIQTILSSHSSDKQMTGPTRHPETLVNFNQLMLHSNPEAQDSSIHCSTILKFCETESHLAYPVCILCWLLFRPGMDGWWNINKPECGVDPVWVNTLDSILSASWSQYRRASTRCTQTGLKYHQLHWISVQYCWSVPDNSYLFNVQVSCCKIDCVVDLIITLCILFH